MKIDDFAPRPYPFAGAIGRIILWNLYKMRTARMISN
jgi:hypothetical protein